MATKSDFTAEEWNVLQMATTGTVLYLSTIDAGFWDTFKEAGHAGKFVASQVTGAPNLLVRDLAHDARADYAKGEKPNANDIVTPTLEHIAAAAAMLAEKAPEDLEAFKGFIVSLAETVAEAAGGVSDIEAGAVFKIKEALG
ncbi:MAG: hypothetical protein HGB10_07760 [Coriobacteriia bacterium]|nr:hypothetical protein [Coriobacteriia bacterium]